MEAKIIDNSTLALADVLNETVPRAEAVKISVAFMTMTGLSLITDALGICLQNRGRIEFIVGLDFLTTEPDAVLDLITRREYDGILRCLCFRPSSDTFHPKLYILENTVQGWATVVVGSSNVTRGGLQTNLEVNAVISGTPSDPPILQAKQVYARFRASERRFLPSQEYLERYAAAFETRRVVRGRQLPLKPEEEAAFKAVEDSLPGTAPTQRDLVIEAIRALGAQEGIAVALDDIYARAEEQARMLELPYKWDTFRNSIRRAIYQDMVGNNGLDLFIRAETGQYALTEAGASYNLPEVLVPLEAIDP